MTQNEFSITANALIRAARQRSNAAIAVHDLAGIAREWMAEVSVLSSTGKQTSGRAANQANLARQFELRPDTKYVRTPASIDVFAAWSVAAERGDWVGTWTEPDGPLVIGGNYQAQWRLVQGAWLIAAELFVPTYCSGGAYCTRHPQAN